MAGVAPAVPVIEFTLSSIGMSKGIAQTDGPQALARGEVRIGALFLGGYVKNVDSSTSGGETAALAGVRTKAAGFDVAVSAAWKWAIDAARGSGRSALELNASATRKFGPLTPRLSIVWSSDDIGSTRSTLFAEGSASYSPRPDISASAAFGRRQRSGGPDYDAWNAGLTWRAGKRLSLDLRYYDTDGANSHAYRARAVVSARASF